MDDQETFRSFDTLPSAAYVRAGTVALLFCTSVGSIWRWSRAGTIPRPKKLGPQVTAWNVGELRTALGIEKNAA